MCAYFPIKFLDQPGGKMRSSNTFFHISKWFIALLSIGLFCLQVARGGNEDLRFTTTPSFKNSLMDMTANPENRTTLNLFNDICFLNPNVGFCVGSQGRILFTEDGGTNWYTQESGVSTNLQTLFILDENHIWVGGEDGTILFGNGQRWERQLADRNYKIFDIQFWDQLNGFAMAGNQILITSDGGKHWQLRAQQSEISQIGIHFQKPGHGWTYGGTVDSGAVLFRWDHFKPTVVKVPAAARFFFDMDFIAAQYGWLVDSGAGVLKTTDGGNTWNLQPVSVNNGMLYKIDFFDQNHGWLISQLGEIYRTQNGGTSWELAFQTPHVLLGLHFITKLHGWVVGKDGLILKTDDGGKTWIQQDLKHSLYLSFFKGAYCVIARKTLSEAKLSMHIPVATAHSTPLVFQLNESNLSHKIKTIRTVRRLGDNWLAEIIFRNIEAGDSLFIPWSSWVLQKRQNFSDLPKFIDVRLLQQLPDSVRPYLAATKIAQSRAPEIQEKARELAQGSSNLLEIVKAIIHFTGNSIAYQGGSEQDALATLRNRIGVCNGKANLAMALLRSLGIPARTLMVANTHFIIEYFIPTYGWVRAEPTQGKHIQPAQENIVMWIASPEDENASPYNGIVCYWGTGNQNLAYDILYDQAEQMERTNGVETAPELAETYLKQAKQVWQRYHQYVNYNLSGFARAHFDQAVMHQCEAINYFQLNELPEFSRQLELAQTAFEHIDRQSLTRVKETGLSAQEPFILWQNYPNPFNSSTLIQYSLQQAGHVMIRVYNIAGQEVKRLVDEYLISGNYSVTWNGSNNQGQAVASGIYFFQMEFANNIQKREAILLK
jgi:photosystem II stability/assembly factor-like uncharacterized protein